MKTKEAETQLKEIAERIKDLREVVGYTTQEMADFVEISVAEYEKYENGKTDLPFTFIHKCSLIFGVELTDLLEGQSANLSSYTITRKGKGIITANEDGKEIKNMASLFNSKLATPYYVTYDYSDDLQRKPIHTDTHGGQEFDLIIKGSLKIKIGDHEEILNEGDSIYYKSSTPHGMIAINGEKCEFLAMIMAEKDDKAVKDINLITHKEEEPSLVSEKFVETKEDSNGALVDISFKNENSFNFAFDIVDVLGREKPDERAMVYVSNDLKEKTFTFKDIKDASSQAANYFVSLGIKKGDKVMLVLKRHYQFWFSILGLHKIGAIAIPATNQLLTHDFEYRFKEADVSAIVCTGDGATADSVEEAEKSLGRNLTKIIVGNNRPGWHAFDEEYNLFSRRFRRIESSPKGDDPMIMFFTSGTTGYPKIAMHSYKYALGHYVTAKYWHWVEKSGLHFTISETGWGKALWGKLYGQWMCEGSIFVYDFDRFHAENILPMFKKYNITTFCAPPTMYRMLIKEDLSKYDLSSIKHATTAGEALNPEVYSQFEKYTGLKIAEGYGQTEMTLGIGNLTGMAMKVGSMGKPIPNYGVEIIDEDSKPVDVGVNGEIAVKIPKGDHKCGIFLGYYNNEEETKKSWHDGYYRTGDVAWKDEDGYFWYVGRADDVIKSSGYRIGPFEIENVIMELPYVLECGVSAAPDPIRGQVVKASIVLVKGTQGTDELKKEIQDYVKKHTAPYKYPRIVEFREELPKTISGKIIRSQL